MEISIHTSGPFFTGDVEHAIKDGINDGESTLGEQASTMIKERLHQVLRHPTGRYERSIHTVQRGTTEVVTDGGIVYGPWLEGVSSRNSRTRFKGYATFRRTLQEIEQLVGDTFDSAIGDALRSVS